MDELIQECGMQTSGSWLYGVLSAQLSSLSSSANVDT